ncbi:MAG: ABC transporter ATP-binding protein, partial [Nocardioidaceae bacterium]
PQGTREVRGLIRDLAGDGTTVLVSSHLLAEIEQVATHVGIMSGGKLLTQGRLDDVLSDAASSVRIETPRAKDAAELLAGLGFRTDNVAADVITTPLDGRVPEDINAALVTAGIPVRGFAVVRPALEELFVHLTGEGFDVLR